jgi:hypothetical protein
VLGRWAEPAAGASPAALQAALRTASAIRRARFPAVRGRRRQAVFPALAAGGRPYAPAAAARRCDARRVWDRLAQRTWRRRVDKVGRISVDNRSRRGGRRWARQEVVVGFGAAAVAWVIRDGDGTHRRTHAAPELRRERILAPEVTHRRPPRPHRGKRRARTLGGSPYTR